MVGATAAVAALLTAPAALLSLPPRFPAPQATASLVVLGVLCTGAAFVIFYALVASDGPGRASLVGYIAPGFSVVYGVALLSERFTATTAAGLLAITGGSWLAAEGRWPWRPRPRAAVASSRPGDGVGPERRQPGVP
jgi:drug/metabolite transporter (DMT)-like permease